MDRYLIKVSESDRIFAIQSNTYPAGLHVLNQIGEFSILLCFSF